MFPPATTRPLCRAVSCCAVLQGVPCSLQLLCGMAPFYCLPRVTEPLCRMLWCPDVSCCVMLCCAVLCCSVHPVHVCRSVAGLPLFCMLHSLRHLHCADLCAVPCCAVSCCAAVFTLFTSVALWLDSRFTANASGSEAFSTAGRAVKAGLTACDIVSESLVMGGGGGARVSHETKNFLGKGGRVWGLWQNRRVLYVGSVRGGCISGSVPVPSAYVNSPGGGGGGPARLC